MRFCVVKTITTISFGSEYLNDDPVKVRFAYRINQLLSLQEFRKIKQILVFNNPVDYLSQFCYLFIKK